MITLHELTATGFGVFKHSANVRLAEQGRVLILGENRDSDAAESNGAGKTTIMKALAWGLYGRTIDGLKTDVIHRDAASAEVVIEFSCDRRGERYRVTRRRTQRAGSLKLVRVDVSPPEDASQNESSATQQAIEKLLGLDWDGFRCTVMFGQGDNGRFASRELTDKDRKGVLGTVLHLQQYEDALERARGKVEAARRRSVGIAGEITTQQGHVNAQDTAIARAEGRLTGLPDAQVLKVQASEKRRSALTARRDYDDHVAKGIVAEQEASRIDGLAREVETKVTDLDGNVRELLSELGAAGAVERAHAVPGPCPTCRRERDYDKKAHDDAVRAASLLADKQVKLDDQLARARTALRVAENDHAIAKRTKETEVEAARTSLRDAERLQTEAEDLERGADDIERKRLAVVAELEEAKAIRLTHAHAVDAARVEHALALREQEIADWWVKKGFGPKGVPAYAIEQSLPVINARANRHLLTLADGDIEVIWSATTEGTSGAIKEELTQTVRIEGISDATPSGGQQKKIELATELALAEMMFEADGLGVDALFLDEALDGLDREGQARVCSWLEGLGASSIFVISHDSGIAERFDRQILVVKEGGCSEVVPA